MKFHKVLQNVIVVLILCLVVNLAFAKTPKRIISLKPNITQTLIEMGYAKQIVGITKFCNKPNEQAQVIGDYRTFDVERILRLKPDLVLLSKENTNRFEYEAMSNTKIKTLLLDFTSWQKTLDSFDQITKAFGDKAAYREKLQAQWNTLQKTTTPLQGKTYSIIVQRQPLMVAGNTAFLSTVLSELGLKNAFQGNQRAYPTLDEEIFIRADADLVFDMSHSAENGEVFLNKSVVALETGKFLPTPKLLFKIEKLFEKLN